MEITVDPTVVARPTPSTSGAPAIVDGSSATSSAGPEAATATEPQRNHPLKRRRPNPS
jgi:hypothetical protein